MSEPQQAPHPPAAPATSLGGPELIGQSTAIRQLREAIHHVADSRSTVLIAGEDGTGTELVARAIHDLSMRRDGPFVSVHCAAIPEDLIATEWFGQEPGAFTDARTSRNGRFELADGGTLFLDEMADLSFRSQSILLRVLEEREFTRVGGACPVRVDVRLIGATHVDVEDAIREGRFREDLFSRLNVVPLPVPPLRERSEDIPLLVRHFLARHGNITSPEKSIDADALDRLVQYDWPGNVREMENLVKHLVTLSDRPVIHAADLPANLDIRTRPRALAQSVWMGSSSLTEAVDAFERGLITEALQRTAHVQTRAARLLGITRRILKYKMDTLGIPVARPRSRSRRLKAA
ncbi:MAG: sigma-54-dependent Fis family transcriptional regulator [Nitrospirae bacterium]|nr:sigma-54-dependent Fis family transcriptional regulator [Nitrospirota bacterium]